MQTARNVAATHYCIDSPVKQTWFIANRASQRSKRSMVIFLMKSVKMRIADDYKAIADNLKRIQGETPTEIIPNSKVPLICTSCEHRQLVDDDRTAWTCDGCGRWSYIRKDEKKGTTIGDVLGYREYLIWD